MTRRKNPNQRNLEVQWSTEKWVPHITVRPAVNQRAEIQALYDPFSFVPGKPRKRKQPPSVLWVRSGTRSSWR